MAPARQDFIALNIAVLTVSDTRTEETDKSGRLLVDQLLSDGHHLADKAIARDDIHEVRTRLSTWIADRDIHVILITGGTGFSRRDITPEAVGPLLDKRIDGFGELFRQLSFAEIGSSTLQSRAFAGLANGALVFAIPGSAAACRTAWQGILHEQLDSRHSPCNFVQILFPPAD